LFVSLATLLGLVVAIGMVEIGLRVFDPIGRNYETEFTSYRNHAVDYAWKDDKTDFDLDGTLYRHKPDLDLDLGSFRLRTNALGFRGPEVKKDKPAGTCRILVLGDSVAFGWGVNDEVTFLRRWEHELSLRPNGRRCEVVNTGHPMYDTTQEAALLRDEGMALHPDVVLLVYVVNDIEPTRDVVETDYLHRAGHPEEALPSIEDRWTRMAAFVKPLLPATAAFLQLQSNPAERLRRALPAGTDFVPELFGKGPRGWERSKQALLLIRALCADARVPFLLLDNTMPALRALPGFCHDNGIDYDELRLTEAEQKLPIYNSRLDTHSNALGNELMLQKLQAVVSKRPSLLQ